MYTIPMDQTPDLVWAIPSWPDQPFLDQLQRVARETFPDAYTTVWNCMHQPLAVEVVVETRFAFDIREFNGKTESQIKQMLRDRFVWALEEQVAKYGCVSRDPSGAEGLECAGENGSGSTPVLVESPAVENVQQTPEGQDPDPQGPPFVRAAMETRE